MAAPVSGGGRMVRGARAASRGASAASRGADRAFEGLRWLASAVRRAAIGAAVAAVALWLACLVLLAPSSAAEWLGTLVLLAVIAVPAAVLAFTSAGLGALPELRQQAGDLADADSDLRRRLADRLEAARQGGRSGIVAAAKGLWTVRGLAGAARGALPAVKVLRTATLLWAVAALGAAVLEAVAAPVVLVVGVLVRAL